MTEKKTTQWITRYCKDNVTEDKGIIVLSLFDGMACGLVALKRAGIKVDKYYASEIDKHAITVARKNHPEIIHIGDVENITQEYIKQLGKIDLVMGGSPCQGFSRAGIGLNFDDPRSRLFFIFAELVELIKPNYFLLENVMMKQEHRDIISRFMGVKPIKINSALVSAQTRSRLYWTNIPGVKLPEDKGIMLEDIIESGEVDRDKSLCLDRCYFKGVAVRQYLERSRRQLVWEIPEGTKKGYVEVKEGEFIDLTFIRSKTRRGRLMLKKSNCLIASPTVYCKVTKDWFRKFTVSECEKLQTLPVGYTEGVPNTYRYQMIGNGWTVDVISHILQFMKG